MGGNSTKGQGKVKKVSGAPLLPGISMNSAALVQLK